VFIVGYQFPEDSVCLVAESSLLETACVYCRIAISWRQRVFSGREQFTRDSVCLFQDSSLLETARDYCPIAIS
jgi:hypothetical protein